MGKALGLVAIAALDPITVFLTEKDIFASGGNGTLGKFIVDLTLTKYSALKNINGSVAVSITKLSKPNNRIIVTRVDTENFSVVNGYCTHQQNTVVPYNATTQVIACSAPASAGHGSTFDINGKLILAPAKTNLKQYTWIFDGSNTLSIEIPGLAVKDGKVVVNLPQLYQNFPNPVKDVTTIRFRMDYFSPVVLTVTDIKGNIIAVLHDGGIDAGEHSFDFDASIFGSGTYFYHLNAGGEIQTKQMIVVK